MLTGQRPARERPPRLQPQRARRAPKSHAPLDQEAVKSVDDILDRAYKLFAALPHRTLSQSRARFVRDAAQMLAAAESQLVATGMAPRRSPAPSTAPSTGSRCGANAKASPSPSNTSATRRPGSGSNPDDCEWRIADGDASPGVRGEP